MNNEHKERVPAKHTPSVGDADAALRELAAILFEHWSKQGRTLSDSQQQP